MPTYKDVLLKTEYYKERVIKEMIQSGFFPDDRTIQDRLGRIDKMLAIFKHKPVSSQEAFDTNRFNQSLAMIYEDLSYLYQLLYEETVKEYEYIRSFVNGHLKELESLSDRYHLRSRLETETTSLGETILFKSSGFSIKNENNSTYIDLGEVSVSEGSTLSFIFDADNVKAEEVLLSLVDDERETIHLSPHNHIQDVFTVPGSPKTSAYTFEIDQDQIVNTAFKVSAEGLNPSTKNQYLIFGGEGQVQLKESIRRTLISVNENNAFYIREPGLVEFYIYKGTYANFNFTRKPEGKNFKGNTIEGLSDYHYVAIRSEGELAFNLATDGKVFAVMRKGLMQSNSLFFPEQTDAKTFLIEEISRGQSKTYYAFIEILSSNEEPPRINSVAIKELSALGVLK